MCTAELWVTIQSLYRAFKTIDAKVIFLLERTNPKAGPSIMFDLSNTRIVGSNLARGMYVCMYVCPSFPMILCLCRYGTCSGSFPSQMSPNKVSNGVYSFTS